MKTVRFDEVKNRLLKEQRGVGFEDVLEAIQNDNVLDIIENPNHKKYKDQYFFILKIKDYVYAVPFRIENEGIVLITIYASRKYKKKYNR